MARLVGTPSRARRLLAVLGVLFLAAALLSVAARVICLRVFHVTTPSMEPTIHGAVPAEDGHAAFDGQGVLVAFGPLFDLAEIERFDLVVIDRGEGTPPFVKRVAGLPGERLQLSGGDLLIDGARLAPGARRPPPINLFSWQLDDFDQSFHYLTEDQGGPWTRRDRASGLHLDATKIQPGSDRGMALFMTELADDVRLGNGQLQRGAHQVNDGAIAFDVRLANPDASGHLRARLVEDGDIFEAELTFELGRAHARILRYPGGEQLATTDFAPNPSLAAAWTHLTFENRDNHLFLTLSPAENPEQQHLSITVSYIANRPYEAILPPGLSSIAPRAAFGADGLIADFQNIEITRDLFWIPTGPWGTRPQIELGPNEYFLLGDNSANSLDSRYWGPIPADQIIGKPIAIVGPWSDRRWL